MVKIENEKGSVEAKMDMFRSEIYKKAQQIKDVNDARL